MMIKHKNNSQHECFRCGKKEVCITGNSSADECGYSLHGIVSFYTCLNCGAEYEVFEQIHGEEEKK